ILKNNLLFLDTVFCNYAKIAVVSDLLTSLLINKERYGYMLCRACRHQVIMRRTKTSSVPERRPQGEMPY
ncbi:MAG: hypothetical protein QMD07_08705, partial [Thermodesulfovibrionales bacterium]|nr:hypothetical protein [Thermodesulfovibrionales bacterium]